MTIALPISLSCNIELTEQFEKLHSILNKLEAQLNFQTMTAGWYGDEAHIIDIKLMVETEDSFHRKIDNNTHKQACRKDFADDVVCFIQQTPEKVFCYIALTQSEVALLTEHNKLLAGFVDKKLTKVINLTASELKLPTI